MSELLSQAKEQWLYWRIFLIRIALFSLIQLGSSFITATANVNVSALDSWAKFTLGVGIFITWGGTMLALMDQTLGRLSKGQLPTGSGDTQPPFPIGSGQSQKPPA